MVKPPEIGVESDACVQEYLEQLNTVKTGLKERATLCQQTFDAMKNVTCSEIEGAMYAFPRVHFSQKFIKEAESIGKKPDFLYCMEMVNKTGIMTVPGSGFGQQKDTYHFRITNLVSPTSEMEKVLA